MDIGDPAPAARVVSTTPAARESGRHIASTDHPPIDHIG
jgi:hypothetical protein